MTCDTPAFCSIFLLLQLGLTAWCGTLSVTRVWPEHICYKPGETARIDVWVTNGGAATATATVTLTILHGLNEAEELPGQTLTIPAGKITVVTFSYPIPRSRKWGHEALATVSGFAGAVQASGYEYFTVGSNPWEVGHYSTLFWIRDGKKNGRIDNEILPRFRKLYITTIEGYSWQPSVFDGLAPGIDVWRSGQGGYMESKEDWQYLVQRAHANGMAVVTYIQYISYGPYGMDFVRKHPEWLNYGDDGRPNAWFTVDKLAQLRENPEADVTDSGGVSTGLFPPGTPEVGEYWIDQMAKSKEMFGWDGFRSDGTPGPTAGHDYTGKLEQLKDQDAASAQFIKHIRTSLSTRFPEFKFGWNWQIFDPDGNDIGRKQTDAQIPNSYMLWESFNGAGQPSSVLHNWKRAAHDLQRETGYIREHGGFSHAGWMPSNRYLEAVASACGTQMDCWGDAKYQQYRAFEFRWSEFIWDNALRYVRPGGSAVRVEAPASLWWQDFVHTRSLPNGGKRLIVHLLNMPAQDDDAWADRPPVGPPMCASPLSCPRHETGACLCLSPDVDYGAAAAPGADGAIVLPQVALWTVVAADFVRK